MYVVLYRRKHGREWHAAQQLYSMLVAAEREVARLKREGFSAVCGFVNLS